MSKYAEHNWYTLAFDADKVAEVIQEDYDYRNGKTWGGSDLSQAIEWMRQYNEHDRTLFRVSVSVEAVNITGVSAADERTPADDDAVERVAKAIYMADIKDLRAESEMWLPWETVAGINSGRSLIAERYRRMARTVIAVMEADVSRRLLSDKAKIAAARHMQELSALGVWDNRVLAYEGMKAALAAIGIEVAE